MSKKENPPTQAQRDAARIVTLEAQAYRLLRTEIAARQQRMQIEAQIAELTKGLQKPNAP